MKTLKIVFYFFMALVPVFIMGTYSHTLDVFVTFWLALTTATFVTKIYFEAIKELK